ncbi:hypothetical protein MKEN_01158300 [Mycena kentingensis (nom. inval.)]|nr:hypothetical protein MKEN_01158300 [Mycena kentingensis (nom. inval.)]
MPQFATHSLESFPASSDDDSKTIDSGGSAVVSGFEDGENDSDECSALDGTEESIDGDGSILGLDDPWTPSKSLALASETRPTDEKQSVDSLLEAVGALQLQLSGFREALQWENVVDSQDELPCRPLSLPPPSDALPTPPTTPHTTHLTHLPDHPSPSNSETTLDDDPDTCSHLSLVSQTLTDARTTIEQAKVLIALSHLPHGIHETARLRAELARLESENAALKASNARLKNSAEQARTDHARLQGERETRRFQLQYSLDASQLRADRLLYLLDQTFGGMHRAGMIEARNRSLATQALIRLTEGMALEEDFATLENVARESLTRAEVLLHVPLTVPVIGAQRVMEVAGARLEGQAFAWPGV